MISTPASKSRVAIVARNECGVCVSQVAPTMYVTAGPSRIGEACPRCAEMPTLHPSGTLTFPRPHGRGPIEALPPQTSPSGVPIFPRPDRRGPIEASYEPARPQIQIPFPRPDRRGPIGAGKSSGEAYLIRPNYVWCPRNLKPGMFTSGAAAAP